MKTIFHANIDGHEVVLGFGEAFGLIDPVATNIKIAPLLQKLPEQQQMNAVAQQINAARQAAGQAFALAEGARQRKDAATMARQNGEYQAKLLEIAELEKQLPPLVTAFEAARARIITENAAYTHPPQGESLIDDAQAATMQGKHAAAGPDRALLMTGEYVRDLRGRDFWLPGPWRHMVIDKLGEDLPVGALMPDQLTDAQRSDISVQEETDRIAALTPEERAAEIDRVKAAALAQAAQTRSELEIAGDSKALAKSQAAYQEALAGIAEKYGV
ncbi:MAG: hypothetical protein IMZ69_07120 [Spirochaetes bacterium]|nr:hypothetical protein [Spirochaetota bacterium]